MVSNVAIGAVPIANASAMDSNAAMVEGRKAPPVDVRFAMSGAQQAVNI
jgi:hypothetical protein